jgi:hypothetical protein
MGHNSINTAVKKTPRAHKPIRTVGKYKVRETEKLPKVRKKKETKDQQKRIFFD